MFPTSSENDRVHRAAGNAETPPYPPQSGAAVIGGCEFPNEQDFGLRYFSIAANMNVWVPAPGCARGVVVLFRRAPLKIRSAVIGPIAITVVNLQSNIAGHKSHGNKSMH